MKDVAEMTEVELQYHYRNYSRSDLLRVIMGAHQRERAMHEALTEAAKFLPPSPVVMDFNGIENRALARLLNRKK